jgi:hypothetical protein
MNVREANIHARRTNRPCPVIHMSRTQAEIQSKLLIKCIPQITAHRIGVQDS